MLITGNWSDILDVSFRKIFDQAYNDYPEQYSTVFNLDTSDRNYEKFSTSTGFGMAKDVGEAEEILNRITGGFLVKKFSLNTENTLTGNAEGNSKQAGESRAAATTEREKG